MQNKKKKEIRSINSDDNLYSDFHLEELEERLEMAAAAWICGVDCPQADCGIDGLECGVDGVEDVDVVPIDIGGGDTTGGENGR